MTRPRDYELKRELDRRFIAYECANGSLPGIENPAVRACLVEQMIESERRNRYIVRLLERNYSSAVSDPRRHCFDPLMAAIFFDRRGDLDEACWLVFLSVHFGKHVKLKWKTVADIYGALDPEEHWAWNRVSSNVVSFRGWLERVNIILRGGDGLVRRFGNHRKYESFDAWSNTGTGAAVASYVDWIRQNGGHASLFATSYQANGNDRRRSFIDLFHQMDEVTRFGRTAKFDYLTMLGKLGLADIEPGSAFLVGATGPFRGAKLLFDGDIDSRSTQSTMDRKIVELEGTLLVGMQVMEDSLCNWQKSPSLFKAFRG